jgi:hypothetical protein
MIAPSHVSNFSAKKKAILYRRANLGACGVILPKIPIATLA